MGCEGGGDPRLNSLMKERDNSRGKNDGFVNFGKPLPDSAGDGAGGTNGDNDGDNGSAGGKDSDGDAAVDAQGNTISRIGFYCSEDTAKTIGVTLKSVNAVSYKLFDTASGALAAEDSDLSRAQARAASLRATGSAEIDLQYSSRYQQAALSGTYYVALCDQSAHASCTIPMERRSNPLDKDDGKYSTKVVGYIDNVVVRNNAITSVGKGEVLLPLPATAAEEDQCAQIDSPLIIDLAGDGIALSSLGEGVAFDLDGDGKLNKSAWTLDADDAFLAYDLDANGRIDGGHELFGNHSIGPDGKKSANGFLSLAKYDGNRDGKIDANDAIFAKLTLWRDRNRNGVSEGDEMTSLAAAGIVAIDLSYVEVVERDRHGNEIRQRALVHFTDQVRVIVDAWLKRL